MEAEAQATLSDFRNDPHATAKQAGEALRRSFVNPEPGNPVLAADFLHHLNLDTPEVNAVLRECYKTWDNDPELRQRVYATLRGYIWITLRGENQLSPGYKELNLNASVQRDLGFPGDLPTYETLRYLVHGRLAKGSRWPRMLQGLLKAQRRALSTLGQRQVQDASPLQARRTDRKAPFNPHYKVRMHKAELRWDPEHEALLTQAFYNGVAHEGRWLLPFTRRLEAAGIKGENLTVDNGYVSFRNIAQHWRLGQSLRYRWMEEWDVNAQEAQQDVLKRYQKHRDHANFLVEAPGKARIRFLADHGSLQDLEAVGRFLRDYELTGRLKAVTDPDSQPAVVGDEAAEPIARLSREDNLHGAEAEISAGRSQNEGLNAEFKRLPIEPARRGAKEMLRRFLACSFAMHAVQLTRLQNGVTNGLCRTADIV